MELRLRVERKAFIFYYLFLLLFVFVMQLGDIFLGDLDPSGALHVIDAHHATGHGVTMRGVIDGATSQLVRFRVVELPFVLAVEHAVRVRRAAAHREDVVGHASAVVTDIVQARSLKSPSLLK